LYSVIYIEILAKLAADENCIIFSTHSITDLDKIILFVVFNIK